MPKIKNSLRNCRTTDIVECPTTVYYITMYFVFFFVVDFASERLLCEGVVVPEGVRERTQGYQLRMETAPVLL